MARAVVPDTVFEVVESRPTPDVHNLITGGGALGTAVGIPVEPWIPAALDRTRASSGQRADNVDVAAETWNG